MDNDGNAEVDDVLAQKHVQVQNNLGSFVAVGTFQPAIEIWNLDVLDPIEPTAVLGGPLGEEEQERYEHEQKKQAKGKKGKKGQDQSGNPVGKDGTVYTPDSHTDAVMCLSWNAAYVNSLFRGNVLLVISLLSPCSRITISSLHVSIILTMALMSFYIYNIDTARCSPLVVRTSA